MAGMALSHSLVSIRFVPGVVGAGLCGSAGSSASTRSAATTASIAAADAMSSCVLSPFSNTRRLCTEATDGDADSDAREIWSTRSKNTRCSASLTLCAASSLSLAASRATLSARLRKAFLRSSAFLTAVPGPPQSLSELYGPSNVSVESSSSSSPPHPTTHPSPSPRGSPCRSPAYPRPSSASRLCSSPSCART